MEFEETQNNKENCEIPYAAQKYEEIQGPIYVSETIFKVILLGKQFFNFFLYF